MVFKRKLQRERERETKHKYFVDKFETHLYQLFK